MTLIDKEIIKRKIRYLHVLSQQEIPLRNLRQVSDALHDIADVLDYLNQKMEALENSSSEGETKTQR